MSTLVRTLGGLCRRRVVAFVETLLVLLAPGAASCFAEELTGLVDRSEGAAEAFSARGIALEALFTRSDLPV